ncbi:MAG: hypothetical protein A3J55_02520 [Candidatus Ryanbacteria bacterium RIFCSPHIGHO2_02_FULL_45_17b]|uniref:Glycosyltransferase RgtA/B/C/D-like domain-containing protein n=1 Tax=Candidatus Ryanbacteria bacterium RIFCSPHIGHO2_01_FULL_45_22 TaxID=1802114 RepID=A0A1G2FYT3_9BACT|nr:MAG: hypothetical protein A2719_00960 [Candidatus Ryanbacteria bacterium RIFCSPHIGHO2_01_FULL_45_22]OGZ46801.1 MAG: hypothetical protein A3J55_02520 [Candidatus Ryanbacteria bacterium RIFCSPHIGHO2_02_FULL_45_17b]
MTRNDWTKFAFLSAFAIVISLGIGFLSGTLLQTSFADYHDDSSAYIRSARAILHGEFAWEDAEAFKKPPAYSIFLAFVYAIIGEQPRSVWFIQLVLYMCILFFWYRIGLELLKEKSHICFFLLLTTAYWGLVYYVFKIESELFALFLVTAFLFLLFRRENELTWKNTVLGGVILGALILTKPIFLYATPFIICFFVWDAWWNDRKRAVAHALVFIGIVALLAGSWMTRNYLVTGDYQIEQHTGHIIWGRGAIAEASWRDIGAYTIASIGGDLIADIFISGYAEDPVPLASRRQVLERMETMRNNGVSEYDSNAFFLTGGIKKIWQNPFGYVVSSIPILLELNAPVNHRGFSLAHLFVGTHEEIPHSIKLVVVGMFRAGWLLFLGVVVYAAVQAWRTRNRRWFILIFFTIYVNIAYALVITPIEPRFLVPVLPFYFIFFVVGIQSCLTRVRKIYSVEVS